MCLPINITIITIFRRHLLASYLVVNIYVFYRKTVHILLEHLPSQAIKSPYLRVIGSGNLFALLKNYTGVMLSVLKSFRGPKNLRL